MWECKDYVTKVSIKLKNGMYQFDYDSATGKTYLAEILHEYRIDGLPVASYSYNNYLLGDSLEKLLEKPLKVLLIDRYDMYEGYCFEALVEKSKDCIVLLDLKYITDALTGMFCDIKWCCINLYDHFIEVEN